MQQTPEVKIVQGYIEKRRAEWEWLVERYKSHEDYDRENPKPFPQDFYERTFLTLFVKEALQSIASEHKELGIKKIVFNSNSYYKWVTDFLSRYFVYDRSAYEIYEKKLQRKKQVEIPTPSTSYENLFMIGAQKVPLIVESSLNRFPRLQRKVENKTELKYKTGIILSETGQETACILVVPPEHILHSSLNYQNLSNSDYFQSQGGLIARLYTSEEGFRNEVREAVGKNGLPVL